MSNSFDDRATITCESEDGLSRTVYTARLISSRRDSYVIVNRFAFNRLTRRHQWTYAPPPPATPPEVLAELANTLAERVRAATLGAER